MGTTRYYLDTSALNQLVDDPAADRVIGHLTGPRAVVFVSAINVAEVAASSEAERRLHLLKLAKALSRDMRPMTYPSDLLRISLDAYSRRAPSLDVSVGLDRNDIWIALDQPELVDDRCRDEFAAHNRQEEAAYREMHEKGREGLRPVVEKLSEADRRNGLRHASALGKLYFGNAGFLKAMFAGVFERLGHPEFSGREQTLLQELEPWTFFAAGMSAGIHNRAIKDFGYGWRRNAGGADTKQAIYLAFCDVFVTADQPQRRALKPIAKLGHYRRAVISYTELASRAA